MEITISIKNGTNTKDIAEALRKQAEMFEGVAATKTKKAKPVDDEDEEETEEEEVEGEAESNDEDSEEENDDTDDESESEDDEEDASDESDDDDEDDEPAPKKSVKLSPKEEKMLKEVNKALKDRARKSSFEDVQKWLKKKFKVTSVNQLKPAEFADVIKAAKAK